MKILEQVIKFLINSPRFFSLVLISLKNGLILRLKLNHHYYNIKKNEIKITTIINIASSDGAFRPDEY